MTIMPPSSSNATAQDLPWIIQHVLTCMRFNTCLPQIYADYTAPARAQGTMASKIDGEAISLPSTKNAPLQPQKPTHTQNRKTHSKNLDSDTVFIQPYGAVVLAVNLHHTKLLLVSIIVGTTRNERGAKDGRTFWGTCGRGRPGRQRDAGGF